MKHLTNHAGLQKANRLVCIAVSTHDKTSAKLINYVVSRVTVKEAQDAVSKSPYESETQITQVVYTTKGRYKSWRKSQIPKFTARSVGFGGVKLLKTKTQLQLEKIGYNNRKRTNGRRLIIQEPVLGKVIHHRIETQTEIFARNIKTQGQKLNINTKVNDMITDYQYGKEYRISSYHNPENDIIKTKRKMKKKQPPNTDLNVRKVLFVSRVISNIKDKVARKQQSTL